MIRFMYWFVVLVEVLLVLAVLLLFVITDSRTIKYVAEHTIDKNVLSYESIEGNLFDGLAFKNMRYKSKPLFSSALIHWNPLRLVNNQVNITNLKVEGIELDNILEMLNELKSENSNNSQIPLPLSLSIDSSHFDINPYLYEGVKFSSFTLETGQIELSNELNLDMNSLFLKFDSDIVNVTLKGKIAKSALAVDTLVLKNISTKEITKLTHRLSSKNSKSSIGFLKNIKIKHIIGTMKPVQYGDVKIKTVRLDLYGSTIYPLKNFKYDVKKVTFKGKTNFGDLNYKGHIKNSNIYAKGDIILNKTLFSKYSLPLNFQNLKKLPSTLRLNDDAVWIDIEHQSNNLLLLENDFNINVFNAKHKLYYDYKSADFTVDSELVGDMTYAKSLKIKNRVVIDKKGFSYEGEVEVVQSKNLPKSISEYLLKDVSGVYKGTSTNFEMSLDNRLLYGDFSMPRYKSANLSLQSKGANIVLNRLLSNLPIELKNEIIAFKSKSHFDFKNLEKSKINVEVMAGSLKLNTNMNLEKPYKINFMSHVQDESFLNRMLPKVNISMIKELQGSVVFNQNTYDIKLENNNLNLSFIYNSHLNSIEKGTLNIEGETFMFNQGADKSLLLETKIRNLQKLFKKIKNYYDIKLPNLQGDVDLKIKKSIDGTLFISLESPNIKYLSEEGVTLSITNIFDIEMTFSMDKNSNIVIDNYKFKLDNNEYVNTFYAYEPSILRLEDDRIVIEKLWFNDKAIINGYYNFSSSNGKLNLKADNYAFKAKDFDLLFNTDLVIKIKQEKIEIDGLVELLGNTITYEVTGSGIVEDSDIIIVEDMLKEKESAFQNLKLFIKIKSKKPLTYIGDDINVEFMNELSVLKSFNQEMLVTGVTTVTKGFYKLEDKEFVLDTSHLYFTGDVTKPLLDIKANYEKDEYNVHIFISGTTDVPIVNFNSEPYLTQQEILSLILFDGTGSSSGKGAEAYTLLGGVFAKGLIKSLGINVDHLLLGTDAQEQLSLEVGKRISKNISVLYLHKDGLDGVKVRVEHSRHFETDIIIQPPNTSSIEFLYKQDR